MKTCERCKKKVPDSHQCWEKGGFLTGLVDFIGDALDAVSDSFDDDSDFGSD